MANEPAVTRETIDGIAKIGDLLDATIDDLKTEALRKIAADVRRIEAQMAYEQERWAIEHRADWHDGRATIRELRLEVLSRNMKRALDARTEILYAQPRL